MQLPERSSTLPKWRRGSKGRGMPPTASGTAAHGGIGILTAHAVVVVFGEVVWSDAPVTTNCWLTTVAAALAGAGRDDGANYGAVAEQLARVRERQPASASWLVVAVGSAIRHLCR